MNKQKVPKSPVTQSPKKFRKAIIENQKEIFKQLFEIRKQIASFRKELKNEAEKIMQKEMGDKIHMIDSTLKDVMVQRKIFIEKGYITREEVDEKYKQLKEA